MKINDRVRVANATGFTMLRTGDTGTIVKMHTSKIGQGALASVKWDNPPRNKTSKIYLSRLAVINDPARYPVGGRVHLASAFKSSPARTNCTVILVTRAKEKPTWLYRLRLDNGKTVKVYETNLVGGAYATPVAAPAPAENVHSLIDRIRASRPGDTIIVIQPPAARAA